MTDTAQTIFTLDWDEWQKEWHTWIAHHPELTRTRKVIPGKNFLADEIIGTFRLPNGRIVELSEVTFPNLVDHDPKTGMLTHDYVRGIGLTWTNDLSGKISEDKRGIVVHSFTELEAELS
jgi:hypothetical protein